MLIKTALALFSSFILMASVPPQQDLTIYLDKFPNEEVNIIDISDYYFVNDYFYLDKVKEVVYTIANLNARDIPNVNSECDFYIPYGTELTRIGHSKVGWDLVKYENEIYFVWNEYLTEDANDLVQSYNQAASAYLGAYRVTFYCNCSQCCGVWAGSSVGVSGMSLVPWYTCACGSEIPFGTHLYIDGLGEFVCVDRGVGYGCIDIYVNNHYEIPSWGAGYFDTYLLE